ncbi:MAG TPA: serine hydrolase domain-containing protein [Candidatus Limnocylindrales bacterium]
MHVFRANRPHYPTGLAGLAAALLITATACGSTGPTSQPTASPTAVPTVAATPSPVALASIVPVPTSALVAPSEPATKLDDAKTLALQAALDGLRTTGLYPGVSAAIVFPNGTLWKGVSGVAVVKPATALTSDTLFSVGSISKTFIAALVGRLAQIGTIGLDDPLDRYVPDFPNAANISLRQLLNHTSGLQDLFSAPSLADAILAKPAATWTAEQVLARLGPPYFAPGKGYHYSNTNFVLLGLVIEKATGQTVASLVRSAFLTPLGMNNTYLQTEETAEGPKAHGYCAGPGPSCGASVARAASPRDNSAGDMLPFTAETTAVGFAGAYASTASDLATWASALYGGAILDPATLSAMADTSPSLPYKPKLPYGMGFEQTTLAGQIAWGHRGLLDGFWSAMFYLPSYHVTVVVLINANWADAMAAAAALAKIAIS